MTDRPQPTPDPELTPPIAEVPDCPPGTVPGWLDQSGNPTSCVGDNPLVQPLPELGTPLDVYLPTLPLDIPGELANTGTDDWLQWAVAALILVIAGVALWIGDNK